MFHSPPRPSRSHSGGESTERVTSCESSARCMYSGYGRMLTVRGVRRLRMCGSKAGPWTGRSSPGFSRNSWEGAWRWASSMSTRSSPPRQEVPAGRVQDPGAGTGNVSSSGRRVPGGTGSVARGCERISYRRKRLIMSTYQPFQRVGGAQWLARRSWRVTWTVASNRRSIRWK